ncbi:MAG: acyl carrier protein [Psychrobium sp.]|nr:acyl carrier protein [Psychrobium sp.]
MNISLEKLNELVIDSGDISESITITGNMKLDEIGIDSVGFFTLIFNLEEHLNIELDEDSISGLTMKNTVNDLFKILESKGIEIIGA